MTTHPKLSAIKQRLAAATKPLGHVCYDYPLDAHGIDRACPEDDHVTKFGASEEFRVHAPEDLRCLIEALECAMSALEYFVDGETKDGFGSGYACTFCDMGGAGYSSKGDGHHDDVRDVCPVSEAQQALASVARILGDDGGEKK